MVLWREMILVSGEAVIRSGRKNPSSCMPDELRYNSSACVQYDNEWKHGLWETRLGAGDDHGRLDRPGIAA